MSGRRQALTAAALIGAAAVLAYGGLGIADLGFYHDDWWFLSVMRFGEGGPLAALFADGSGRALSLRPLDAPLLALLYTLFGLEPLGWQLASLAAVAACAGAAAALLSSYGAGPRVAVLGALLALSYPNKDGAMFWPMTVIVPASLALFLGATRAHVEWARSGRRGMLVLAAGLLLLSLALYEQCILMAAAWALPPERPEGEARRRILIGLGAAAGVTALFLAYKMLLVPRLFGVGFNKPLVLSPLNALLVSLRALESSFGWRMALAALSGARDAFLAAPVTAALAAALPWAAWLLLPEGRPGRFRRLAFFGAALFVLGYLPFLVSDYRPTPLTHMNRLNFIPAFGLALAAASLGLRHRRWQALGAAVCSLFLAAHVGFASYWAESRRLQETAKASVLSQLERWPAGTTLLFTWPTLLVKGRAPLHIASWDSTGAVRVWTGDRTRKADALRPGAAFRPEGVAISQTVHPYPSVRVLDHRTGRLVTVSPRT